MIIEKIDDLCIKNGTNLTALCKEITGSSGNLPTWKKDKIRPDWLRAICLKFNISSDYLLDLPIISTNSQNTIITQPLFSEDREWLNLIHRLPEKKQIEFKAKIEGYLECYEESVATDELKEAK